VALANLVTQAVRRGDVVIIIDPKNSRRLKRVVQRACDDYRGAGTFMEFHPSFPETGVRLEFTFNWQKSTEIASRIQSVMPPDTAGAFSAFGWDAVNVVPSLVELEERPNLAKLTRYIEGGIEPVLESSLHRYYEHPRRCLARVAGHEEAAARRAPRQREAVVGSCQCRSDGLRRVLRAPRRTVTARQGHRRPGAHVQAQPGALPEDHCQPAANPVHAYLQRLG
jgi:hypothetical protein